MSVSQEGKRRVDLEHQGRGWFLTGKGLFLYSISKEEKVHEGGDCWVNLGEIEVDPI